MIKYPKEREEQWEKIEPYLVNGELPKDAPEEIKKLARDFIEWSDRQMGPTEQ